MQKTSSSNTKRNGLKPKSPKRQYEAEALALQSLRLIAAPDPKDDLSDDELKEVCQGKRGYSSALIQQLIEHIKSI